MAFRVVESILEGFLLLVNGCFVTSHVGCGSSFVNTQVYLSDFECIYHISQNSKYSAQSKKIPRLRYRCCYRGLALKDSRCQKKKIAWPHQGYIELLCFCQRARSMKTPSKKKVESFYYSE